MRIFAEIIKNPNVAAKQLGQDGGAFDVVIGKQTFCVVASFVFDWDHVSVSIYGAERCPRWNEMQTIKEIFFDDSEVCMQLHPAKINYINNHPYTLHLWSPQKEIIPLPPIWMV